MSVMGFYKAVNIHILSARVIRSVIGGCSKQLGPELSLAAVYSSIRRLERMTSYKSTSALASLQSHNLEKSCVLVYRATVTATAQSTAVTFIIITGFFFPPDIIRFSYC